MKRWSLFRMPAKLKDIERLKKTKCRTQKERVNLLIEQADIYAYHATSQSGKYSIEDIEDFGEQEIELRKKILEQGAEFGVKLTDQMRFIGEACERIGAQDEALKYFNKFVNETNRSCVDFQKRSEAYYTRGRYYFDNGFLTKALPDVKEALKQISVQAKGGVAAFGNSKKKVEEMYRMRFKCEGMLASIYTRRNEEGDKDKSQIRLNNVIRISKEHSLFEDKFDWFNQIATEEAKRGCYSSAEAKFKEALASIDHLKEKDLVNEKKFELFYCWGQMYIYQYKFQKAMELFRDAHAIYPKNADCKEIYKALYLNDCQKIELDAMDSTNFEEIARMKDIMGDICFYFHDKFVERTSKSTLLVGALARYTERLAALTDGALTEVAAAHVTIATVHNELGDHESELEHYRQALEAESTPLEKRFKFLDEAVQAMQDAEKSNSCIVDFFEDMKIIFGQSIALKAGLLKKMKVFLCDNMPGDDLIFEVTEELDQLESEGSQVVRQLESIEDMDDEAPADIKERLKSVKLPKAVKQSNSNKDWWELDRNRLGETKLQRMVIDLKLTDEPRAKLSEIEQLITIQKHPVHVWDNTGLTPLHEAANWGLPKVAKILLKHGAKINALTNPNMEFEKEDSGEGTKEGSITPLQDAIESLIGESSDIQLKKLEFIQVILEYGPNVLRRNSKNETALKSYNRIKEKIQYQYKSSLTDDLKNKLDIVQTALFKLTEKQRDNPRLVTEAAKSANFPSTTTSRRPEQRPSSPEEAIEVAPRRLQGVSRLMQDDDEEEEREARGAKNPMRHFLKKVKRAGSVSSGGSSDRSVAHEFEENAPRMKNVGSRKRRQRSPDNAGARDSKRIQIVSSDDEDSRSHLSSLTIGFDKTIADSTTSINISSTSTKRRLTVSYLNRPNYQRRRLRITIDDCLTIEILKEKIIKEIIRKEERKHDTPLISIFVGEDREDRIELTPSDFVSDAIDFDKGEGDKIFIEIHDWSCGFSLSSALDDYRECVRKAGVEPSEDCVEALISSTSISLSGISFTSSPQAHISAVLKAFSGPTLVDLNLSAQNLESMFENVVTNLSELPSLSSLQIAKCRLKVANIEYLANSSHQNLRSLDIQANVTGDIGPQLRKLIENYPGMRELRICRMKLTDKTFESQMDLSQLTILDISQNLKIGGMGIENIRMNLGETFSLLTLEAAQITSSEDIFTPLTKLFLDTVQELKNLNISKNNIKPDAIEDNLDDLETNCDLERINFSNNREISANREFFCSSAGVGSDRPK